MAQVESLAQRVGRAFRAVLGGIALTAVVTSAVFAYVFLEARPATHRYLDAANAARQAHAAMIDEETGIRGFLLTGQRQYLEPYLQGRQTATIQEASLVDAIGGDGAIAKLVIARRVAEQAWVDNWVTPAVETRPESRDPATLDAFLSHGKALFDRYRARHARLAAVIDDRRNGAMSRETIALATAAALDLLVLLATALVARRQNQRLQAAVGEPVAEIVDTIDKIRDGQLDARAAESGPQELRVIAGGLADMADGLSEARAVSDVRQRELAQQADRLNRILTMARELAGSLNLRYVLRTVGESAVSLGPFSRAMVWLLDEAEGKLAAVYDSSAGETVDVAGPELDLGRDLVGQAAKYGRTLTRDVDNIFRTETPVGVEITAVAVPMVVGARVIGVLKCFSGRPARLSPMTLEMLETLASQAGTAVEAARLHERTEELSQTDALTRLFNRRRLDADLASECYRATRYDRPLGFVMLDIDHFKRFNDRYGHQRGDEALEMVAKVIAEAVRDSDTAYRFGGEELAVLCRETYVTGAAELAERLRAAVERRMQPEGVTASFGVAAISPGAASPGSPEELVGAADAALYEAKRRGRNRVVTSGDPSVTRSG